MTRRKRSEQPRVILIATDASHAELRAALAEQGFAVIMARSLLAGYAQICDMLASKQPAQPTLILLDPASYDTDFPECSGIVLAAAVAGQMRLGRLQSAWLVSISADRRPESDTEALIAGCQRVIRLPPTPNNLARLRRLAARPAPIPHRDTPPEEARAIYVLQTIAQRLLHAVQSAQTRGWTSEEVALVLRWLTPYPASPGSTRQSTTGFDPPRMHQLLRALGGPHAARRRLESIAEQWQPRYPLHSQVLRRFLDGWERREIVRYFVEQRLYEDSRIYHCIKELPQRICEQLRREQATRQAVITSD